MSHEILLLFRRSHLVRALSGVALVAVSLCALPAVARAQGAAGIGVVDAGRVFQESDYGLSLLADLKDLREKKQVTGRSLQETAKSLQDRIEQGRLALSPDKIEELQKELEEKVIELQRFEDDAKREIDLASSQAMTSFNQQIMPVIDIVGREEGFTLIFNKYEAGLLFADETVDITEAVITRFNEQHPAPTADAEPSE